MSEHTWKGWALGDTALYLDEDSKGNVCLHIQYGNDVRRLAYFLTPDAASEVQAWLDASLTAVGLANRELASRLVAAEQ